MKNRHALNIRCKYGISSEYYSQMLLEQNGVCKICRKHETYKHRGVPKRLSVDHCHKTSRIRGLLCSKCNINIGRFGDDPLRLRAAADYLERYG